MKCKKQTPQELPAKPRTTAQVVLSSGMPSPPSTADTPPFPISQDTPLLVAEARAWGWAIVYRGTITSAGTTEDLAALEDALPGVAVGVFAAWSHAAGCYR